MTGFLKRTDRILLEMHTGILLFGIICQIVGAFFAKNKVRYAGSLWFGILFAAIATIHMAKTLDRALADPERTAKVINAGYVFRYVMFAAILAVIAITDVMSFPVVFVGYMSLKVAAYIQPFTHKFYNWLFCETDPVPQALPDEESEGEENVSREDEGLSR